MIKEIKTITVGLTLSALKGFLQISFKEKLAYV